MSDIEIENSVEELVKELPEEHTIFSLSKQLDKEEGSKITIKHEEIKKEEKKFKRKHVFRNLESFMKYIDRYKSDDKSTSLYYDRENKTCHCVLFEREESGGNEIINCDVDTSGLINSIREVHSINDGDEFLSWLKENKLNVDNFRDLFFLMSAIKISSKVEKTDIKGKNAEYNYTIKTEIMGEEKGEPVELPDSMSFVYKDYSLSFEEPVVYKIECDIYYRADREGNLRIEIIANNQKELKNQQDKTFYSFICDNAPEDVLVTIGTPDYTNIKMEGDRH